MSSKRMSISALLSATDFPPLKRHRRDLPPQQQPLPPPPPTAYPAPPPPTWPPYPAPQSIAGVLSDQMRAPQSHTALPVPPQLRRDPHYSPPNLGDRLFEEELLSLVHPPTVSQSPTPVPTVPTVPQPFPQPVPAVLQPVPAVLQPVPAVLQPVPAVPQPVLQLSVAQPIPQPTAKPKPPPKPRPPKSKAKPKQSPMPPPSPPTKPHPRPRAKPRRKAPPRSHSLKPADPTPELHSPPEEDRLYCVCNTPYDEDKIMIACDRCDQWYHPACVAMSEVEVDLVDQYICDPCAQHKLGLRTTYKQRCHRGLKYISSHDSLPTCWKPARGSFSKYCSDDCGVAHMRAKILQSGRDSQSLWPAVKNARRREGITLTHPAPKSEDLVQDNLDHKKALFIEARKAVKDADDRELAELLRRLDEIMAARQACKAELERVLMRRRLLDLAVERPTSRACGWDARLEMNDDEWTDWAATQEGIRTLNGQEDQDEGQQWWCQGPEKCPRHNGWQNIRDLDVQAEVDSKNASIKHLTDRERELRRRIEDINPPSAPARSHGRSSGKKKNQTKRSVR